MSRVGGDLGRGPGSEAPGVEEEKCDDDRSDAVDDSKVFSEALAENKYTTFDAVNPLLVDRCVALVRAPFLLDYEGPIDIRQTLETIPDALFHGPLELGDERHGDSGALMPSDVPIALSYTWAPKPPFYGQLGNEDGTKDHPDPEMFYLAIMRRVLAHMFICKEYKIKTEKIYVFWDWMSLFQIYKGNVIKPGARTEAQQKKFNRCMNAMHLWYGNAHIHIWMMTKTPKYNKRAYEKRGW